MTSENTANRDVLALMALAARLDHALSWQPVPGPGLLVENGVASTRTVVTLADEQYAAESEPGQPPVRLAPVTDPDAASESLAKRLAMAADSAPAGEGFYRDDLATVQAGSLKAMGVW